MSRSDLSLIEQRVKEKLGQFFADTDSPVFIVAVSGGMDSMALLHIFKRLDITAIVCHVNYQKRGEASKKDAQLVQNKAVQWGFECHVEEADPTDAKDKNFQQWARDYRYDLFRRLAREHQADGIAVAHNEDDQVETILQKIFRGAGLASWSAMAVWDGEIFRPLLNVSREQIEEYVQSKDIPYRTDESNLETDFARNLLRNEWLDKLEQFFPGWKENVLRIEEQANSHKRALDWIADRITEPEGIDRNAFDSLDIGMQKAVILHMIKKYDPAASLSRESLERVSELSGLQAGKAIQLVPNIAVIRDRDHYVIKDTDEKPFKPVKLEQRQLLEQGMQIKNVKLLLTAFEAPNYSKALYLDAEKINWPVTIRRWKEGDSFQPFGMQGHQQVANHLTNRKVSAADKKNALVIESFDKTICAIIFPPIKNRTQPGTISEQMKCDSETARCLKITHRR